MFNPAIVDALTALAGTRTEDSYPEHFESLLHALPCSYDDLVDVAYDCESVQVRIEALELIAARRETGFKTVLGDLAKADPDEMVRRHAEGLLFRAFVGETMPKPPHGGIR